MNLFFSCDWGTSTFRLRLVDENSKILSAIKTDYGIAAAFGNWRKAEAGETNRIGFYKNYIFTQVKKIAEIFNQDIAGVPIVLSGMASSSIGMLELPYKALPFNCDGSDLLVHNTPEGLHNLTIISGVSSEVDVIRGEETMLVGCDVSKDDREQLFIFPGTHSKHIEVTHGRAENFTTYMTGELFDLLSNKSILAASVKKHDMGQPGSDRFFLKGVIEGVESNLANCIFHVRTNQLFKKATPGENYDYLSGLLVGYELKPVVERKPGLITLVCSEELKNAYLQALDALGLSNQLNYRNADEALIAGQRKIMQRTAGATLEKA